MNCDHYDANRAFSQRLLIGVGEVVSVTDVASVVGMRLHMCRIA